MRLCYLLPILAACSVGAPPGFSSGSQWSFPLVDPLDDGVLVTPVTVNGKGPYLFAIDPDANAMIVDERVVVEAGMVIDKAYGPRIVDETGAAQPRFFAELLHLRVGTLEIENRTALVVKHGTYYVPGRAIDGVIGRTVLADSLVFGFDRDRGVASVTTQQAFVKPEGAAELHYTALDARFNADVINARDPGGRGGGKANRILPVPRRLAKAKIGDANVTMHVDLGGVVSQLRDRAWPAAGLQPIDRPMTLLDETGTTHEVTHAAIAASVTAGGVTTPNVAFVPYVEARWDADLFDGALGLNFFQPYSVWANWDRTTLYLVRRGDPNAALQVRLARWGAPFVGCVHAGCITARVIAPQAAEANAGVVLAITRDPNVGGDLEITLAATNRPDLPRVRVNLPAGTDRAMDHLHDEWAGAQLHVIDASPFPRHCRDGGGCIELMP